MNNPNYLLQQHYASSSSSSSVSTNLLHPNPTLHEYHADAPLIYDHQHQYHHQAPYANLLHPNPTLHQYHAPPTLHHASAPHHQHQYHHQAPPTLHEDHGGAPLIYANLLHPNPTLHEDHAGAPLIYAPPYANLLHPNPEDHAGAPLIYDNQHQYHHQAPPYANGANAIDYLDSFPIGYRFMPYDDELVQYYLKKKVNNEDLPPNNIHVVNIYASNPDELAESYKPGGENEWYFFATRDRKYMNGKRPSRTAKDGFWKASGADKHIMYEGVVIGFKKVLVFYQGKPPKGVKTDWLMHEFTLKNPPIIKRKQNGMRLDDCVLCKIYTKKERKMVIQKFLGEGEAQIEECSSDDQTLHNENGNSEPNEMLYDDGSINEDPNGISQPQTQLVPVMPSTINLSTWSGSWHDDYLNSLPDQTEWIWGDI